MLYYMIVYKTGLIGVMDPLPESEWWFGTSPEGFGTIAMLINFTVSIVVSRLTPAPPKDVQEIVENIRIPSGAGEAAQGH
ncbi:MAG: cation acetate symporter, partial [Flavobacteriales bacterium]|nr:cation acetate symporter [Flavobacteriales bacterium]